MLYKYITHFILYIENVYIYICIYISDIGEVILLWRGNIALYMESSILDFQNE